MTVYTARWLPVSGTHAERMARVAAAGCAHDYWSELVCEPIQLPPDKLPNAAVIEWEMPNE